MKTGRRSAIVAIGFFESLIFSGCLFGWPSLLHVLQQEGVYSHLCLESNDGPENKTTVQPVSHQTPDAFYSSTEITIIIPSTTLWDNNYYDDDDEETSNDTKRSNDDKSEVKEESVFDDPLWLSDAIPPSAIHFITEESESDFGQEERISYDRNEDIIQRKMNIPIGHNIVCSRQTTEMTLIYTVAAVAYGITAIAIGFALDFLGLWFTRILGSLLTTGGFLCLAFTSKESSWLLWPAMNLIALGSNQLRLSSYQNANLFPQHRTTILIAYSSAYSISTTLFLLVQYGYAAQIPFRTIIFFITGISILTIPNTLIMPKMKTEDHVETNFEPSKFSGQMPNPNPNSDKLMKITSDSPDPDDDEDNLPRILKAKGKSGEAERINPFDEAESSIYKDSTINEAVPLRTSLWTLSAILHLFWAFFNFFLVLFYTATFIPWVHKMTDDPKIVAHYNEICGLCALIAPIFIPIAGLVTDWQIRKASTLDDRVEKLALTMRAPAFTMAFATLFMLSTMICKLFFTSEAVYVSLVMIAISRPFIVGSSTSYIRIRFHPTHFNRLNGILMTVISIFTLIQYPIILLMKQSTEDFIMIQIILIVLLVLSLAGPGHLMIKPLARKYARSELKFRTEM